MKTIRRKDIYLVSDHSDLTKKSLARALQEQVYPDEEAWRKFLRWLLLSLGVGFSVAGIVFFFAYNWAELPKFVKIGIAEGLVVASAGLALLPRFSLPVRNSLLMGATALIGVLFAVFGQIYQTGANAYDFFLAWTVFATLWVAISSFPPLWLFYLVLLHTTVVLYSQQVAEHVPPVLLFALLFALDTVAWLGLRLIGAFGKTLRPPRWLTNLVALAAVTFSTLGLVIGIVDNERTVLPVWLPVVAVVYALGVWFGFKNQRLFYLSAIPFSLIVIVSAFLIQLSESGGTMLFVSLFIVAGVTLLVKGLVYLQKKWK